MSNLSVWRENDKCDRDKGDGSGVFKPSEIFNLDSTADSLINLI